MVGEETRFRFIHVRDCRSERCDPSELRRKAVANRDRLAADRVEVRPYGSIFAVLMGGNFEASLLLSDRFWDETVAGLVEGPRSVAIPARDILALGSAPSPDVLDELRAAIGRVFPKGDHLISPHLDTRAGEAWMTLGERTGEPAVAAAGRVGRPADSLSHPPLNGSIVGRSDLPHHMRFVRLALVVVVVLTGSCPGSSDAMSPKTIEQLVDTTEPEMALVHEWIKDAKSTVELLGVDPVAVRCSRCR